MKYWLLYVEGCSPKTKGFDSEIEMVNFINTFIEKYGSLDDKGDNWIDQAFYGEKITVKTIATLVRDSKKD